MDKNPDRDSISNACQIEPNTLSSFHISAVLVPTPLIGWPMIPAMGPGTSTNPGESTKSPIMRYDVQTDGPELLSRSLRPEQYDASCDDRTRIKNVITKWQTPKLLEIWDFLSGQYELFGPPSCQILQIQNYNLLIEIRITTSLEADGKLVRESFQVSKYLHLSLAMLGLWILW